MRILVVETASPKRVRRTVEEILAGGAEPELTLLCGADPATAAYFSEIPGIRVVSLPEKNSGGILRDLRRRQFDILHIFWTGEKKYRFMKLLALRLRAEFTRVDGGDGNIFRLTWKALIKFGVFRWQHPLPTDHYEFVLQPEVPGAGRHYPGEKILIVQSARPRHVLVALDRLKELRLFRDPRYILFCRNLPEIVERFRDHPMIDEIRTHTETMDSWSHLRELRKERFDGAVVFFTGDPSYWKIKYFAFFLGARHKVIFNENNDCFFFSVGPWLALIVRRLGERSRLGAGPSRLYQLRPLFFPLLKLVVFPVRFVWLLLVWLRLRLAS